MKKIAEKIDRISHLPLEGVQKLLATIRDKGAKLAVPGIVDLSKVSAEAKGVAKVVLESVQDMLLRVALQMAREDYEDRRPRQQQGIEIARQHGKYRGRRPNQALHGRIAALREGGYNIAETSRLAGCSVSQVKRVWESRAVNKNQTAR